jgi:hypothetical protein
MLRNAFKAAAVAAVLLSASPESSCRCARFRRHHRLVRARTHMHTPCQPIPARIPIATRTCASRRLRLRLEVVGSDALTIHANSGHNSQNSVSHARSLIVSKLSTRSRLTMHFFAQPDTLHSAVHEQACSRYHLLKVFWAKLADVVGTMCHRGFPESRACVRTTMYFP